MKMKPFDLEKAKAGAPLCTRDGRTARLLCSDIVDKQFPLAVAVVGSNGKEYVNQYTNDGCYQISISEFPDADDLFMAPAKHEGWVNVYPAEVGDTKCIRYIFNTKEEADENSGNRVACVRIEWEE